MKFLVQLIAVLGVVLRHLFFTPIRCCLLAKATWRLAGLFYEARRLFPDNPKEGIAWMNAESDRRRLPK